MIRLISQPRKIISGIINDTLDLLYPPVCGLCGQAANTSSQLVCRACLEKIESLEMPFCIECRQFIPKSLSCDNCRSASFPVFSLGYFVDDLRKLIHDLKFKGLKPLAGPLGRKLAAMINAHDKPPMIDCVVAVPLHSSRLNKRGFNQAEEIASALALQLKANLLMDVLYATRRTKQQARLPAALRRLNVKGAFAVDDQPGLLKGKTVLLVDDVSTTGATLLENAQVLKAAGAKRIIAAVAATAL